MPSNILLNARTAFLAPQLRAQGFGVCEDHAELGLEASCAVDLMQAHERPEPDELAALIRDNDRVVLINAETPLIIRELAQHFDHAKVTFVTTGRMNWRFQQAQVIEFENFFAVMQRHYSDHWLLPELQALRPHAAKPRHFDAMLGLIKTHRSYVYQQIQQGDTSKFLMTYNGWHRDFVAPAGVHISGPVAWTGQNVQYHGDSVMLNHLIPINIYNETAYSIVTETYTSNDFSFFTEKTAKCFLARRLFVMFAGQHYLRNLRDLGFQTFGSVIDESYDLEADADRRWHQAWQQVQYLCDQDQQRVLDLIHDVVEHNYHVISTRSWDLGSKLAEIFG